MPYRWSRFGSSAACFLFRSVAHETGYMQSVGRERGALFPVCTQSSACVFGLCVYGFFGFFPLVSRITRITRFSYIAFSVTFLQ